MGHCIISRAASAEPDCSVRDVPDGAAGGIGEIDGYVSTNDPNPLPAQKHGASELGWKIVESRLVLAGPLANVWYDRVLLPQGATQHYAFQQRADAVIVVPVTSHGEIVLIRQYRYPVDTWCLETPAGGCHDAGNRSHEEVARKELREEIGGEADQVEYIGSFLSAPAYADEKTHVFAAWDVRLSTATDHESGETIDTQIVPAGEAVRLARTGGMQTGPCALAVIWCEERLRARGFL